MKKIVIILFLLITFSITKSQSIAKQTYKIKSQADSLISIQELISFVDFMRKNFNIEWYEKVKPEGVIQELWNWKLKSLSDTTKNK